MLSGRRPHPLVCKAAEAATTSRKKLLMMMMESFIACLPRASGLEHLLQATAMYRWHYHDEAYAMYGLP